MGEQEPSGSQSRPRARSEAVPPRREPPPSSPPLEAVRREHSANEDDQTGQAEFGPPRRAVTVTAKDLRSPRRSVTSALQPEISNVSTSLRRRSTARSGGGKTSTIAGRSRLNTLVDPEPPPQVQATYEPYVHPAYAELNPAYEQPANTTPVWSLAKPLPRVVRPGMIPTRSEIQQGRQNAELPGENSQKAGLEVDPNDLEAGRIQPTINPTKLSAQLNDSRAQREDNFVANVARRGTLTSRLATRPTRASSTASKAERGRANSTASITRPLEENRMPGEQEDVPDDVTWPGEEGPPLSPGVERIPTGQNEHSAGTPLEAIIEYQEPPAIGDGAGDDSSLSTLRVDEDPELSMIMDPIKTFDNPPLEDVIYNHHTLWSVYRTQYRDFLAEFLATFIQLTIGFCGDTQVTLNATSSPNSTAMVWGLATMIAIYISGGPSGAHLNPAITIMFWFFRGFPRRKMPQYFAGQFLAGFLAALAAYGIYISGIQEYLRNGGDATNILNGFVTSRRFTFIDTATAFFNEFLGTTFLACTILALGDDQNAPPGPGMPPLIIGLVITALNLSFVYNTGLAMNPARDLAPRLAMLALGYGKELFTNPYWFYGPIAGPILGAFMGATLYDVAIFEGGESPLNYPWARTKRSFHKGRAKWERRLRPKSGE